MAYNLFYERINWINETEGKSTPLGAANLNQMDYGLHKLDERTVELDTKKAEQETVLNLISDWTINETTGVIVIRKLNGEQIIFDLNIEKIPVSFSLSEEGILTMKTDDGSKFTADIGSMIPVLKFNNSDTVSVKESGTGKNKSYTFEVKDGSITEKQLQPNYLANITVQAQKAEANANEASASESSANKSAATAHEEAERAKTYADNAEAIVGVGIATKDKAGLVKGGDNAISEDGTLMLARTTTERELTESQNGGIRIISMDGESQQKQYSGKNLLKNTATSGTTEAGVQFTVNEDNSITLNNSTSTQIARFVAEHTLEDGEYILSGRYSANCFLRVMGYKDGSWVYITQTSNSDNVAFTMDNNSYSRILVQCVVLANTSLNNATIYPMIRLASVTDATYEPYVGGIASPNPEYEQDVDSVEISEIGSHGKNLLKVDVDGRTHVGVTWTVDKNIGKITANGTASSNSLLNTIRPNIDCGGKTVYISAKNGNVNVTTELYYIDTSNATKTIYFGTVSEKVIYSVKKIVAVTYYVSKGNTVNNVSFYPMISFESSTYEPYTETKETLSAPIVLRSIGDAKDVLSKNKGVFDVLRGIKKYSFTSISVRADGTNTVRLSFAVDDCIGGGFDLICNALQIKNIYALDESGVVYAPSTKLFILRIPIGIAGNTTNEAYLKWLQDNVELYYKCTPTFEPLPLADQIALHKLESFGGVTYLFTDSTIEPIIEVEYGTSKVGGYAIKGLNNGEISLLELEQLKTLTNELATQIVAGSEG